MQHSVHILCPFQRDHKIKAFNVNSFSIIWRIYLLNYCSYLFNNYYTVHQRRQWHPTPVTLPGKSHGWRSLVGRSPWGRWGSDTTERLHFHFHFHALEKEMVTHSSVLAWRIPGTGKPGGLPSMGSNRFRHDWSGLVAYSTYVPEVLVSTL